MLPEIREAFGISTSQVSYLAATRELVSGIVAMPGGIFTDMVRGHWGSILALCMGVFGLGWVVMGFSPIYPVLLLGMVFGCIINSIVASTGHSRYSSSIP